MPIPLFLCQAEGGQILTIDDRSVTKDLTNAGGAGGNTFTATLVSTPLDQGMDGGWSSLRRMLQSVQHDGAVTVTFTPLRDGNETGNTITRALTLADGTSVDIPIAESGTEFQVKLALSAFDADVSLGKAKLFIVPKRQVRI